MIKSGLYYVTSRHLNVYFLATDVQDTTSEKIGPCFVSFVRPYGRIKSVRRHVSVMVKAQVMLEDVKYFFYFLLRMINKEVITCDDLRFLYYHLIAVKLSPKRRLFAATKLLGKITSK